MSFTNATLAVDTTSLALLPALQHQATVKNIGDNTVYLGAVNTDSTNTVPTLEAAYPLGPGEVVLVPANPDYASDVHRAGLCTATGTSRVAWFMEG